MSDAMILFIDDEEHIRIANRQTLELAGFEVQTFERAEQALTVLSARLARCVRCDIRLPGMDGLELVAARARGWIPDLPVILITGHGDIAMAVGAIRTGAYDFIEKALRRGATGGKRPPRARQAVFDPGEPAAARRAPEPEQPGPTHHRPYTRCPAAAGHYLQVADTGAEILIRGRPAPARKWWRAGGRPTAGGASRNFVAINCGAVPETIIESELFGHEVGAFTGATGKRIGKFEHADGGTLFLRRDRDYAAGGTSAAAAGAAGRAVERWAPTN